MKVLIADDEPLARARLRRLLEARDDAVELCEAANGLEAIERSREFAPDVILLDIRMPGMDGIEMAKAAARNFPGLRILLVTGYADQRERAADLNGVVVDVLLKPFTLAEIRDRVARALSPATATC
jgi:two-component system cell cycle response regulator CpdR